MDGEEAPCPVAITPSAVSQYWSGGVFDGIWTENWYGGAVRTALAPIGYVPITSTSWKAPEAATLTWTA
jgi:hypothetical protein